jgi:hypothetical protein
MTRGLPSVRIELGETALFTRVYINGEELRGVTRVWFDSGDVSGNDGPAWHHNNATRVHVEFFAYDLLATGPADVDAMEHRPVVAFRGLPDAE